MNWRTFHPVGNRKERAAILAVLLAQVVLPWTASAVPEVFFGQDLNTLPPVGPGTDNPTRLTSHPNSDLAASRFRARLVGVATESFESFGAASNPNSLTFGDDTAALVGSPVVYNVPINTFNGTFPIEGNQFLLLVANSASFFRMNFSRPQAAFGFYATDIEVAKLEITLIGSGGKRTPLSVPTPDTQQPSGSVLFFAVIDIKAPFAAVEFARVGPSEDGFAFDQMTLGRVDQITPPQLSIQLGESTANGILSWPGIAGDYVLEATDSLHPPDWQTVQESQVATAGIIAVTIPIDRPRRFFRLRTEP